MNFYIKSLIFTLVVSASVFINYADCNTEVVDGGDKQTIQRFQVAHFNFEHVAGVYTITLWILLGCLAKIGFHYSHRITKHFPESCLLILLGVVLGVLLYVTQLADVSLYRLNADTFLLFLLPPIVLEAGFYMPNRPFFDNIGTILLFAIVNTLFNTLLIGVTLWAFNFTPIYGGVEFELLHCFLFAALISAVDPVAVIATFVEIGVNDMLYIIVFGESLLNDAVSVVLYRMFDTFAEMGSENIQAVDIVLGATSFLVVALGGVLIGIIFGVIGSLTTKLTKHTRILEPLIVITYSYLSYLTAEMFSTSGILAVTFCGMFLKQYIPLNIAKKSDTTIEYTLKMLANIMETIIFLFMGVSIESDIHVLNIGFVIVTLVACFVYRVIGVFIFANLANKWRLKELKIADMLIMSYGGIRGAVAFALALILNEDIITRKKEFVTATTAVVLFTVFVQGITISPIVKYLRIKKKQNEEPTELAKLSYRAAENIMVAFEIINGVSGQNTLRQKVRNFDRYYLKPFLTHEVPVNADNKLADLLKIVRPDRNTNAYDNPSFTLKSNRNSANEPIEKSEAASLDNESSIHTDNDSESKSNNSVEMKPISTIKKHGSIKSKTGSAKSPTASPVQLVRRRSRSVPSSPVVIENQDEFIYLRI